MVKDLVEGGGGEEGRGGERERKEGEVWAILESGEVGIFLCDGDGRVMERKGERGGEGEGNGVLPFFPEVQVHRRGGEGGEGGEGGGLCRCGDGVILSWGGEGGQGGVGVWDKEKKMALGKEVFFFFVLFFFLLFF